MMFCWCVAFALATGLGVSAAAPGPDAQPFTVHDLLALERISEWAVSPDGRLICFGRRVTDLEANRGRTDLWLVGSDGSGPRRLTSHPAGAHNVQWFPDGRQVAFLSARGPRTGVWKIAVDGGEAEALADLPLDITSFRLSADGRTLALSMEVLPLAETLDDTVAWQKQQEARPASGMIFDRLFIRHWDHWKDGRRSHLHVMPVGGGAPRDVMRGMDADTPTRPFGGIEDYTFTPDGTALVFAARDGRIKEALSTNFDLYVATVEPAEAPRCLTDSNLASDAQPLFSPDGRTLAYLAMERPGYEADRMRLMLRDWSTGRTRALAAEWDRSPSGIAWSPDGRTLYATAANVGQQSLFAIDLETSAVRTVVRNGTVAAPRPVGDRIIYGCDTLSSPTELYSVRSDGQDPRPVTQVNDQRLAGVRMGDFEQFSFSGWNGETVYAYVVKPVPFDPAQRYPVAFLIHGGPQGSFGNHFHYRWNPQVYAGHGYAAVCVDFHGSSGYGQAFTDSIRGDWGGKPLEDLKQGLAAVLEHYPWMDGDRVAALGASYGGYMVNWIAGNWPQRFKCLVNHDGVFDTRMMYFDTEELWFPEWDHDGTPWGNPEGYRRNNPVAFVDRWRTPMLVIHGALDYRVVDTQGIAAFTACQRQGIPSRLLYFPDENHWVLKPHNSILWHDTVLGWLDRWTASGDAGPEITRPADEH